MARKKPARRAAKPAKKAAKKSARKPAARPKARAAKAAKTAKTAKTAKPKAKSTGRAAKAVRKAAAAAKKSSTVRKVVGAAVAVGAAVVKAALTPKAKSAAAVKKPNLDRPRKTVADIHGAPSTLGGAATSSSAARTGSAELKERLSKNTSASPALTAGDVDADWQAAESIGDEAPGGDNPTPDQDVVDEIGRALGVEYEDDEELQGGDEIRERDKHRWELDPSSKDDFEDEE